MKCVTPTAVTLRVADVLDASRLLVALDARHVGRVNAEGYLKSGKEMAEIAEEVARAAGFTDGGRSLLILVPARSPSAACSTPRRISGSARSTSPSWRYRAAVSRVLTRISCYAPAARQGSAGDGGAERIEGKARDTADAGLPGREILPVLGLSSTERRNDTKAGNGDGLAGLLTNGRHPTLLHRTASTSAMPSPRHWPTPVTTI